MISEVIFDLETKTTFADGAKWGDPADLGVSIVSVYSRKLDKDLKETEGKMISFWEKDFLKMWPIFTEADRIIGFNSKRFDVPALRPYTQADLVKLPHFDILEVIKNTHGKRVSLNRLAKGTLDKTKNDNGANAPLYWSSQKAEDLEKLRVYCEMDVQITKEVYDFGLHKGFLSFTNFWNVPFTVKVDFSYPVNFTPKSQKTQLGLF